MEQIQHLRGAPISETFASRAGVDFLYCLECDPALLALGTQFL